jgi:hypothetical protein
MDEDIIIETADGANIIIAPDEAELTIEMDTVEALNFTRVEKLVDTDEDADYGDFLKFIAIDASVGDVTYTIEPSSFTGLTLNIQCKDATGDFAGIVEAATGNIQLKNGLDVTTVRLMKRETINLYSDGTNLREV